MTGHEFQGAYLIGMKTAVNKTLDYLKVYREHDGGCTGLRAIELDLVDGLEELRYGEAALLAEMAAVAEDRQEVGT